MEQVTFRRANLDDLERLLSFEQAIIEAERPFDETIRTGPDVRYYDLEGLITSADAEVLVAESNSQIIGSGYARIEGSDTYLTHSEHSYLGFMHVVPEYRGKGVNKKIIQALEAWTLAQGVTEMQLEVYAANAAAIRAYEKSGYSRLIITMRKGLGED
jgi:GNAT superfamily N-acetyltransferase